MAFVYDEKKKAAEGSTGAPQTSTGSTAVLGAGGTAAGAAGGPAGGAGGQKQGSGWTNMQNYVKANESEIPAAAERVSNNIKDQYSAVEGQVKDFGAKADTVDDAYQFAGDDVVKNLGNQNVDTVKNLFGQNYAGPKAVQDADGYQDVNQAVAGFGSKRNSLKDSNLLAKNMNPSGSEGEQGLDSFFFQQKPAQEILEKTYAETDVEPAFGAAKGAWDTNIQTTQQRLGDQKTAIADAAKGGFGAAQAANYTARGWEGASEAQGLGDLNTFKQGLQTSMNSPIGTRPGDMPSQQDIFKEYAQRTPGANAASPEFQYYYNQLAANRQAQQQAWDQGAEEIFNRTNADINANNQRIRTERDGFLAAEQQKQAAAQAEIQKWAQLKQALGLA